MANTRFNYDICRTIKKNQEATDPGRYLLDVPGNGTHPYYIEDPQIRIQKWGANLYTDSINLESELLGINKVISRNTLFESNEKYKKFKIDSKPIQYPSCNNLTTAQSRAILPPWIFRELPQNDYYFLPLNPQENTCFPFQNNLSTRILEKDYFIPKRECSIVGQGNDNSVLVPTIYYQQK